MFRTFKYFKLFEVILFKTEKRMEFEEENSKKFCSGVICKPGIRIRIGIGINTDPKGFVGYRFRWLVASKQWYNAWHNGVSLGIGTYIKEGNRFDLVQFQRNFLKNLKSGHIFLKVLSTARWIWPKIRSFNKVFVKERGAEVLENPHVPHPVRALKSYNPISYSNLQLGT
jgi:hypothetical protein